MAHRSRLFLILAAALLLFAACSDSDNETADIPDTILSKEENEKTEPPEEMESSEESAETIDFNDAIIIASNGYILGGFAGGQWVDADALRDIPQGGYTAYSLENGNLGIHESITDPDLPESELYKEHAFEYETVVFTTGAHDAMPYSPQNISQNAAEYHDTLLLVLAENGLPDADIGLVILYQLDMNGDGTDEIILYAEHSGDTINVFSSAEPGDYSLLLLIEQGDGDSVFTTVLAEDIITEPGSKQRTIYRIIGMLDINNDSMPEIAVMGVNAEEVRFFLLDSENYYEPCIGNGGTWR